MRKLIAVVIGLVIGVQLYSQVTIHGKLRDNKGKPIPGASVSIRDSYDGAVADSLGNYKFSTTEKGDQTLIATNIGYKSFEQKITIASAPVIVDIMLKEELSELKAVTVISGSFAAGDSKRAATVLNSIDVLTVAGCHADST